MTAQSTLLRIGRIGIQTSWAAIQFVRARPWILLICFFVLSNALYNRTKQSVRKAHEWANIPTYNRVDDWIRSSECTHRTGAFLAICPAEGKPLGIEGSALIDDRGHALLANIYAMVMGRPIDRLGLTILNIVLNATTFSALTVAFFIYGWRLTALMLLIFAARMAVPGPMPHADAPAAHMAAFCLSMVAVVWTANVPLAKGRANLIRFASGLFVAAICLAWSTLIRQPYGFGGFLVVLVIIAARVFIPIPRQESASLETRVKRGAVAIIFLVLATFYPTNALIGLRELAYGIPRGPHLIDHGIAHNLYLGLGVEGNPWGIKWSDAVGYEAATRVGKADYASEEHFANLRSLYMDTVLANPVQVFKIYVRKLWKSVLMAADDDLSTLRKAAIGTLFLVILSIAFRRQLKNGCWIVALAAWLGFGVVMLQGVLAMPWIAYIGPGKLAALCAMLVLGETAWKAIMGRLQEIPGLKQAERPLV